MFLLYYGITFPVRDFFHKLSVIICNFFDFPMVIKRTTSRNLRYCSQSSGMEDFANCR